MLRYLSGFPGHGRSPLNRMHARRQPLACRLLLALLMLVPQATLAADLAPFEARHQLLVNRFAIGEQRLSLRRDGDLWQYRAQTRSTGLARLFRKDRLDERSRFRLIDGRIRVLDYEFHHTGRRRPRHAFLQFDWALGRVINDVAGERWQMPIPPGTLDKLSVQLALALGLASGARELAFAIADGGKLKRFRFRVIGEERLSLPAGRFDTLRLQRLRQDQDRDTWLWCAPELGYLPVQVRQREHEDGQTYLSRLLEFRRGGE